MARLVAKQFSAFVLCAATIVAGPVLPDRQSQSPELTPGRVVEKTLSGGESHFYLLKLIAGQYAVFTIEQGGIDLSLKLFSPSGEQQAETPDNENSQLRKYLLFVAEASGEHKVELRPAGSDAKSGSYRLWLDDLRQATTTDRKRAAADRATEAGRRLFRQRAAESSRQAIVKFNEALALRRETGDKYHEAVALFDLGSAHMPLGDTKSAIDLLGQSLRLWRALGNKDWEATVLNLIGSGYLSLGEFQQALNHYSAALKLNRELGRHQAEAQQLSNLGLAYRTLGDLAQSINHYKQALALHRDDSDRRNKAITLHNLGEAYLLAGDYQQALKFCLQALPMHQAIGDSGGEAHTLEHIGVARFRLGQLREALEFLHQALGVLQEMGRTPRKVAVLGDIATVHASMGEKRQARDYFNQALNLAQSDDKSGNEPGGGARILAGLAQLDRDDGRLDEARAHIETAIASVNSQRVKVADQELRASFFAAKRDYYDFQIDLLMRLHQARPAGNHGLAAIEASEQARARSLLDLLAEAKIDLAESAASPLRLPEMQRLLEPGSALLEYALGQENSFLFVVTPNGLWSYKLPPERDISGLVQELRSALSRPGRREFGRYVQSARRLFEILVEPAAEILDGQQRLLIAADGALHYLPFEALLTETDRQSYLLKRWTVSYAPSASVIASLRQRQPGIHDDSSGQFLAFADPAYEIEPGEPGRGDLRRLVESNREAGEIAKLFPPEKVALFLRREASEDNVKNNPHLARARLIHFAAHARMTERRLTSGLLLARAEGSKEDGLLQTSEVFRLKLQADLVVLSACETGLGKELKGEGVIGLTRALLYAGASSVVVSLWQVSDASTAELMLRFYERLNLGDAKAEALRRAKLELIADSRYSHPYYWSAFVLNGEPK